MFGLRRSGLKLFTAFGIGVEAHWSFLLALLLYGLLGGGASVLVALLVFASVIVHEFGHSLVALRKGIRISGIELHFFGGVAKMQDMPRTPRDELLIAAAGPATSLLLGAGAAALYGLVPSAIVLLLAQINFTLGIFNLLPALPMDGGRILRALLQTKLGALKATRIAALIARGLAVAMGVLGLFYNPFLVLLAVLLWTMAGRERLAAELRHRATAPGHVEVLHPGWPPTETARMFELLQQMARQRQGGEPARRVVLRDSTGRTLVVEEGYVRW